LFVAVPFAMIYPVGRKGQRLHFIAGQYKGRTGWLDATKGESKTGISWYVIVLLVGGQSENATCVRKTSVRLDSDEKPPPTCWEEAMLNQHEDIDVMLDKVALAIAECDISLEESGDKIANIFLTKLRQQHQLLNVQGSDARWRKVHWDYENDGSFYTSGGAQQQHTTTEDIISLS
jgi:hypothetical protein